MPYSTPRKGASANRATNGDPASLKGTSVRRPNGEGPESNGRGPQTSSATDRVSELLHSTVLELWREEHAAQNGELTMNGAMVVDAALPGVETERDGAALPTWKRLLDLTLIILASPLWLPLMLVVMLAVRLSSPGPIFYQQERVGFRGRRFMIYKFRSMKVGAETEVHEAHLERLMRDSVPMAKLDGAGDPRILPWGRILRATGLDELPQLFNVLRGEMSLVGPRPCTVHEFSRYADWQRGRVSAAPGLTGYWQVNGKNKTTFNEMIEMDIYYAKNLSLWLDLKIILQTLPALIAQTLESMARRPRLGGHPPARSNIKTSQGI